MTAITDAFVRAGRATRKSGELSPEAEEIVRRATQLQRERNSDRRSRFHVLPEPQKPNDLRLIELPQ